MADQGGSVFQRDWRTVAFIASSGAAAIHLGATRSHLIEYGPAGVFMLVSGVLQLGWALWFAFGAPRVVVDAGLVGNVAVVCLWAVSRTAGIPWGSEPWVREGIHASDLLATCLEVLIIVSVLRSMSESRPSIRTIALAWIGMPASILVSSGRLTHGHFTAAAALALALAGIAIVRAARSIIVTRSDRRGHETTWFGSARSAVHRADTRTGVVARS